MGSRIPVYLFTGFLGSGKTTVLRRVVEKLKLEGKNPMLVFNELGEAHIEQHLFKNETMLELLNGCICCTIQDDMRIELQQFLEETNDVDVLLIEGTGIANPVEVVETLTHPQLIEKVDIMSVISVIDASHYLEYQSLFTSSKEIRTILKQQVTNSSLLVLNKIDLVDDAKLSKVKKKIASLKQEGIEVIETSYGEVNPNKLLARRFSSSYVEMSEKPHHDHHHHHPFQAVKITGISVLNKGKLEKWLKEQGDSLLRAKGFIRLDKSAKLYSFQYASKQLQLTPIEEAEEACVILIGKGLEEEKLKSSFQALFI